MKVLAIVTLVCASALAQFGPERRRPEFNLENLPVDQIRQGVRDFVGQIPKRHEFVRDVPVDQIRQGVRDFVGQIPKHHEFVRDVPVDQIRQGVRDFVGQIPKRPELIRDVPVDQVRQGIRDFVGHISFGKALPQRQQFLSQLLKGEVRPDSDSESSEEVREIRRPQRPQRFPRPEDSIQRPERRPRPAPEGRPTLAPRPTPVTRPEGLTKPFRPPQRRPEVEQVLTAPLIEEDGEVMSIQIVPQEDNIVDLSFEQEEEVEEGEEISTEQIFSAQVLPFQL